MICVCFQCNEDDTIGDLKKLIAAQIGTDPAKIKLQKVSIKYFRRPEDSVLQALQLPMMFIY